MKKDYLSTTDRSNAIAAKGSQEWATGYGYEQPIVGESEPQRYQVKRAISILRRYWYLILCTTTVVTALVMVYEARKPDLYVASAKVQVNNEMNPAVGGGSGGSIVLSQGADPAYFATQLRIIEGAGLLRRVVRALDLEHNAAFRNTLGQELSAWQKAFRVFGYRPATVRQNEHSFPPDLKLIESSRESEVEAERHAERYAPFVEALKSGLTISPVRETRTASKETRMIDVSFRHTDPAVAAKVVNTIADIYVLQNLERKVESNATASAFLEKRVAELQNEIRSREERLINYARNNQIVSLDTSQNTVVQRLADLNIKLGAAENERISAEAAYIAARQNPMSELAAEAADPRTAGLESQLTSLRQQLAQLKTEYTDEWPEVKRVQRQIAQIEVELRTNKRRAKDTQSSLLEQKYREAVAKERDLRDTFNSQRNAVLAQNEAAINYRILQQEIDSNSALLASLLAKSRETDVILNGTPNNVLLADRATAPQSPSGPERAKNVLLAFISSLFVGVGLAFAAGSLNDRIRIYDNLEEKLGLPVVGRIPGLQKGRVAELLAATRRLTGSREECTYATEEFDKLIVTDAFNEVRVSLMLSAESESLRTVLVTSGEAGEGKTLTSYNLAKRLAELGGKVLLVDADLRSPQLHRIAGVGNRTGLSDLLTGGDASASVDSVISPNISENLDLLSAGSPVADPATLLSSGKLQNTLKELRTAYRFVVVDSPPVLYFADSVLLATVVDSVLIVGRLNYSSSELLSLCAKKLQNVSANVVGVVLNDIPIKNYGYGRNTYYLTQADAVSSNGNGGNLLGLE